MEMKELEYVLAIVEEGSISKAADKLYMAQSSLSQFLTKYEAELDVKLFMRTASGVRPTRSGEIFAANARLMLRQYHQMKGELSDIKSLMSGRIEFGISSFRGSYLIPRVLPRFQEQYPGIDVIIHEHDSYRLRELLATGDLDMALVAVGGDAAGHSDSPIMQDEICIVARRDHPVMALAQKKRGGFPHFWVDFSQAADYEFLLSNHLTVLGSTAEELYTACGKKPVAKNTDLTAQFALSMVRSGLGLALSYGSCAADYADLEYLSIGQKGVFVNLALEYPPNDYRSRAARALDKMIHEILAEKMG